jgi:hypothetical protein
MGQGSGAMSADLLARVRAEIDARMAELRPALGEYEQLLGAGEELDREAATARRRGPRGSAAGAIRLAASGERKRATTTSTKRAASGSTKRAASGERKRATTTSVKRATSASTKRAASGSTKRAASGSAKRAASGSRKRAASGPPAAPRGAAAQAIVAALEHGSHTVSELVLVTAISGSEIRASAQRLQRAGTIARTRREGRVAYALSGAAED